MEGEDWPTIRHPRPFFLLDTPTPMSNFNPAVSHLPDLIRERILLLDGAMGTMIQRLQLDEAAVRGERFADRGPSKDLKNFRIFFA